MSRPSLFEENTRVFSRNRRTVKIQTCEHGDKKYSHQNTNGDIDTKLRRKKIYKYLQAQVQGQMKYECIRYW